MRWQECVFLRTPGRPKGSRDARQRFRRHAHEHAKSEFPSAENGHPDPAAEVRVHSQKIKIEAVAQYPELKQNLFADVFTLVSVQPASWADSSTDDAVRSESKRDPPADETFKSETQISDCTDAMSVAETEWNDPFHADWPFWK